MHIDVYFWDQIRNRIHERTEFVLISIAQLNLLSKLYIPPTESTKVRFIEQNLY